MLLVIRGGATTANRHSRATARASLSVPMLTHEHCYYHGPLVLIIVKKLNSLKHLVRTIVAESHN